MRRLFAWLVTLNLFIYNESVNYNKSLDRNIKKLEVVCVLL